MKNAAGTVLASYLYDEFGRRIVKTVGSTNTLYVYSPVNWQMLEETNGSGTAQQDYIYTDGRLIDLWSSSATALYSVHSDRMMAPQVVTDSAGNTKWSALLTPWGDTRTLTSSGVTLNIRYPGQYFDAETGCIQNGQRELIPQWGRFMEEDPLGQAADENIRAYVSNRPTAYVDPSGMDEETPNLLDAFLYGYGPAEGFLPVLNENVNILANVASFGRYGLLKKATEDFTDFLNDEYGGSKGANHLQPDPKAEGPHCTFRRDANDNINHYETYDASDPRNPNPWTKINRVDMTGEPHFNKVTGQTVPTPHVQGKDIPGGVRPADPSELPNTK